MTEIQQYIATILVELRQTLADSNGKYADWTVNANSMAVMMQEQGFTLPEGPPFLSMAKVHILDKLSRLVSNNVYHRDSWVDIAGYAMIACACLDRENTMTEAIMKSVTDTLRRVIGEEAEEE